MRIETIPAGRGLDAAIADVLRELTGEPAPGSPIPPYSTDIAAAWKIVEAVRSSGGEAIIDITDDETCAEDPQESPYAVTFFLDLEEEDEAVEATAEEAPLAICRALLAAMGIEPK